NLCAAYPGAELHFLTERPSRQVLEGNPHVHQLLVFDSRRQHALSLMLQVRSQHYDLVIDLFGNPRSALLTYFSGARYRVGYTFNWRKYCYNILVNPRGGEVHNIQFNLDALRAIGVPALTALPSFNIDGPSRGFAESFFREKGLESQCVIALNAGG